MNEDIEKAIIRESKAKKKEMKLLLLGMLYIYFNFSNSK